MHDFDNIELDRMSISPSWNSVVLNNPMDSTRAFNIFNAGIEIIFPLAITLSLCIINPLKIEMTYG